MRRLGVVWAAAAMGLAVTPWAAAAVGWSPAQGAGVCREVYCRCTQEQIDSGMVDTATGCRRPCSQEELDKLRGLVGRLKALREVAESLAKEVGAAEVGYMKEIDEIGGLDGPLMKTSVSLANLAGDMAGVGQFKIPRLDRYGLSPSAVERVASATSLAATGGGLVLDPGIFSAGQAMQEAFDNCVGNFDCYTSVWQNRYHEYLEAVDRAYWPDPSVPRSPAIPPPAGYVERAGAELRKLQGEQASLLKKAQLLSVGVDLVDFAMNGRDLGAALRETLEARKEFKELEKQVEKTDRLMDQVLAEIAALREKCGIEGSPDAAGGPGGRLTSQPGAARALGSRTVPSGASRAAARPDPISDAEARRLEAALVTLDRLEALMQPILERIWSRVLPPASPFLCPCWREMQPAFLRALLRSAHPEFAALKADLERFVLTVREPVVALHMALS